MLLGMSHPCQLEGFSFGKLVTKADNAPHGGSDLTAEALEQAGKLPLRIQARIRDIVERLRQWPNVGGAKPLRGERKGCYRIRTGAYRLIFRPSEQGIVIEKVGHRKDVYE